MIQRESNWGIIAGTFGTVATVTLNHVNDVLSCLVACATLTLLVIKISLSIRKFKIPSDENDSNGPF